MRWKEYLEELYEENDEATENYVTEYFTVYFINNKKINTQYES